MLTHLFLSINLFHPQSNSLSYNYPHFTEKENWDSEARLLGKNESYSPGDPEASPGNLASKLLNTVCASCYKVNATRDLNLSAAIFHNNFSKCCLSPGELLIVVIWIFIVVVPWEPPGRKSHFSSPFWLCCVLWHWKKLYSLVLGSKGGQKVEIIWGLPGKYLSTLYNVFLHSISQYPYKPLSPPPSTVLAVEIEVKSCLGAAKFWLA